MKPGPERWRRDGNRGGTGVPSPAAPGANGFSAWQAGTEEQWEGWRQAARGGAQEMGVKQRSESSSRLGGAGEAGVPHSSRCPGRHKSEITGDIVSVQQVLLK